MTELSSLVAPRVSVFQGAERVPITDVLEIILDTSQRQVVLLTGVDCEYAQIYLRNFYRNDSRISVAEVAVWSDVDETCRVLICSESRTVLSYTLSVAPWDRDDVIQYMLGSNPAECGSILKRIRPEYFAMIRGGFNFWKHLIETMLEFPRETDLLAILKKQLRAKLPSTDVTLGLKAMQWFADQLLNGESIDNLKLLSNDPIYHSLLGIPLLRLRIEADRFVELLEGSNKRILQRLHSNERLIEVSNRLQGNNVVGDFLKRCVYDKYASTSVSILSQIDLTWKPPKGRDYQFQNAYLFSANWAGVFLENTRFGGANLSEVCFDNSVLTNTVLNDSKSDGASFVDSCLQGSRAIKASFDDAIFCRAEMGETRWIECNFRNANFSESRLDKSAFVRCSFQDADFRACVARIVEFSECKFGGTDFSHAQLERSQFIGLDLTESILCDTNFCKANLTRATLESLSILECNFNAADLSLSLMSGSRIRNTSMVGTQFTSARLGEIDWEQCDLREADLTGVTFHYGSTRCGIVGSPYPSHGTRTGFYTDDQDDLAFKSPELVRKASLVGCDLRGARIRGVDFYLVDLRDSILDPWQRQLVSASGAILE